MITNVEPLPNNVTFNETFNVNIIEKQWKQNSIKILDLQISEQPILRNSANSACNSACKTKICIGLGILSIMACIVLIVIGSILLYNPTMWRDYCKQPYRADILSIQTPLMIVYIEQLDITTSVQTVNDGVYVVGMQLIVYRNCNSENEFSLYDVKKKIEKSGWIVIIITCFFGIIASLVVISMNIEFIKRTREFPSGSTKE